MSKQFILTFGGQNIYFFCFGIAFSFEFFMLSVCSNLIEKIPKWDDFIHKKVILLKKISPPELPLAENEGEEEGSCSNSE